MDILLAHGYFLYDDPHELEVMRPYPPLGLLYISSHLKQQGFAVGVFDSTFSNMAAFEKRVIQEKPAAVGLYCTLMTKQNVLRMMAFCQSQGCTVILGGPEPPYYAEEYLARGADVIVIGEGELTLAELLPHLAQHGRRDLWKIQGLAFLDDVGQIIRTIPRPYIQDLDAQPLPDRAAIDLQQYIDAWREHQGMGSVSLVGSRGCPYTCTWCSHSVFGESHRRRSAANVAEEIAFIQEHYQPDQLWFVDDVFTLNWRWLRELRDELRARNLRIPFECISRADRMNDEVVEILAEMGCMRLWIGSESGSQRILDAMQRKTTVERVQKMTHQLQAHGIETGMFIMLGYEGETFADLKATVDHLQKASPDIFLTTVAYPIKGTTYYTEVADRLIEPGEWEARTDRDLGVAGRHSRRYYSFATRWMVNAVELYKLRQSSVKGWKYIPRLLRRTLNMWLGRLGMLLTQREIEKPVSPAGRGWYDEKRHAPQV